MRLAMVARVLIALACLQGPLCAFATAAQAHREAERNSLDALGLEPVRTFVGVNRPIELRVVHGGGGGGAWPRGAGGAPGSDSGELEVLLLDARSGRVLDRGEVHPGAETVDLSGMFAVLWTTRDRSALVAQLAIDGRPVGPGIILQPLVEPVRTRNALQALVERAVEGERFDVVRDVASLPKDRRDRLAQQIERDDQSGEGDDGEGGADVRAAQGVLSGYRLHRDRQVVLETTLGAVVLRLRFDEAPNACGWFAWLVEGGYYDGTAFHRIVPRDRDGNPFIAQGGDPTWTGQGGAGMWIDYEPSALEHDLGVVSLARHPNDPNANSAQFFISLSREGCRRLDGRYVAFAEVIDGAEVLGLLLSTPVGPRDPSVAGSPRDRPLDPPVIERAFLRDALPYPERPSRVRASEAMDVPR